jgi:hypothetical protein
MPSNTPPSHRAEVPKLLLKYANPEDGLYFLENQLLFWSSPDRFSSPIEMNSQYTPDFTSPQLLGHLIKETTRLIFQPERPIGDSPIVAAINRWREDKRFDTPEEAQTVLRDLLSKMVAQRDEQLRQQLVDWQQFCQAIRLTCFGGHTQSLTAWNDYAKQHTGMAIALHATEENGLNRAQPVQYGAERPELTTLSGQVKSLIQGVQEAKPPFEQLLLKKPVTYSDEQEWRLFDHHRLQLRASKHQPQADEKPLAPGCIKGVYLGVHSSDWLREEVKKRLRQLAGKTKLLQMRFAAGAYHLEATPIE